MFKPAIGIVLLAVLTGAAPLTGDDIFSAAQQAVLQDAHPRYASYTVDVAFTKNGHRGYDSWRTIEDIEHAAVYAKIFSLQELQNPYVARGTNVAIIGFGTINAPKPVDPIGEVAFAIDQTYGIAPPHPYDVVQNEFDLYATSRTLAIIGRSSIQARRYDVELVDTGTGERGAEYHLKLTPLRNPGRDRLREVWIDAQTMTVNSAIVAGIGNRPPTNKVLWKVDFEPREGATYLHEETALAPLDYGKAGLLHDVTIDFNNVKLSSSYPGDPIGGMQTPEDPVHDP